MGRTATSNGLGRTVENELPLSPETSTGGVPHLAVLDRHLEPVPSVAGVPDLRQALTGRFYTHPEIGSHLAGAVVPLLDRFRGEESLAICDPFGGDGRLIWWLLDAAFGTYDDLPGSVAIELWDVDPSSESEAYLSAASASRRHGFECRVEWRTVDSFAWGAELAATFDIVITNPPWENIKPDRRELSALDAGARDEYMRALRDADNFLARNYPYSQPRRKYAGWGTNLARVGLELSARLVKPEGVLGAVLPASVLADDASEDLRGWLLQTATLHDIGQFPAELRAFGRADVASVTIAMSNDSTARHAPTVTAFKLGFEPEEPVTVDLPVHSLANDGFIVPIGFGTAAARVRSALAALPRWRDLEGKGHADLWAGRELDETGVAAHLRNPLPSERGEFIKGRMIGRFEVRELPSEVVAKEGWVPPPSVGFERLAWRDISRPNQKRRVQATLLQPGWIAGNSLGVAYFRDGDPSRLRWLLGIMSSCVFELQLRAVLSTGHVTLASLRKVHVPVPDMAVPAARALVTAVDRALGGDADAPALVEALAMKAYGLGPATAELVLSQFPKLSADEQIDVLRNFARLEVST